MKISNHAANVRKTIVYKLVVAVMVIFLAMIGILYISINYYQHYAMSGLVDRLENELNKAEKSKDNGILILKQDEGISRTEFVIHTAIISLSVICLGAITFYIVISGVMKPLRQLTEKVSNIDIERASYEKNYILIENGGLEIKDLSRTLDRAFQEIYEGYERQKKFSINVAHEVRTPLAVLSAKIDVFKKKNTKGDREITEFVNSMEKNIAHLSDMVEGLMLLSGNQPVQKKMVHINELLDEIFFDMEDRALEKDLKLTMQGEDVIINTDDQILERALFNLIENGIKYSEKGGSIQACMKTVSDKAVIKISDEGVGISDEDKAHIFDLFYRVDQSRSRETGGHGIGLALVMHIVNRLGGTVSVKDNIPKGSVFEIILPIN
ncbi:MAG: HAMP domain-containing sensor histidine kinase [Hornefia sp.]|nr:HAMP domain-containing sensor histidine kinase [Hornefia sp.]